MNNLLIKRVLLILITASLFFGIVSLFSVSGDSIEDEHTVIAASKVYYARTSKKYHCRKSCRTLARSRKIYSTTKAKAKKMGLKPCKVCY